MTKPKRPRPPKPKPVLAWCCANDIETPCKPWGLHSIHARQESAFACAAALHLHETSVAEEGVEP